MGGRGRRRGMSIGGEQFAKNFLPDGDGDGDGDGNGDGDGSYHHIGSMHPWKKPDQTFVFFG